MIKNGAKQRRLADLRLMDELLGLLIEAAKEHPTIWAVCDRAKSAIKTEQNRIIAMPKEFY